MAKTIIDKITFKHGLNDTLPPANASEKASPRYSVDTQELYIAHEGENVLVGVMDPITQAAFDENDGKVIGKSWFEQLNPNHVKLINRIIDVTMKHGVDIPVDDQVTRIGSGAGDLILSVHPADAANPGGIVDIRYGNKALVIDEDADDDHIATAKAVREYVDMLHHRALVYKGMCKESELPDPDDCKHGDYWIITEYDVTSNEDHEDEDNFHETGHAVWNQLDTSQPGEWDKYYDNLRKPDGETIVHDKKGSLAVADIVVLEEDFGADAYFVKSVTVADSTNGFTQTVVNNSVKNGDVPVTRNTIVAGVADRVVIKKAPSMASNTARYLIDVDPKFEDLFAKKSQFEDGEYLKDIEVKRYSPAIHPTWSGFVFENIYGSVIPGTADVKKAVNIILDLDHFELETYDDANGVQTTDITLCEDQQFSGIVEVGELHTDNFMFKDGTTFVERDEANKRLLLGTETDWLTFVTAQGDPSVDTYPAGSRIDKSYNVDHVRVKIGSEYKLLANLDDVLEIGGGIVTLFTNQRIDSMKAFNKGVFIDTIYSVDQKEGTPPSMDYFQPASHYTFLNYQKASKTLNVGDNGLALVLHSNPMEDDSQMMNGGAGTNKIRYNVAAMVGGKMNWLANLNEVVFNDFATATDGWVVGSTEYQDLESREFTIKKIDVDSSYPYYKAPRSKESFVKFVSEWFKFEYENIDDTLTIDVNMHEENVATVVRPFVLNDALNPASGYAVQPVDTKLATEKAVRDALDIEVSQLHDYGVMKHFADLTGGLVVGDLDIRPLDPIDHRLGAQIVKALVNPKVNVGDPAERIDYKLDLTSRNGDIIVEFSKVADKHYNIDYQYANKLNSIPDIAPDPKFLATANAVKQYVDAETQRAMAKETEIEYRIPPQDLPIGSYILISNKAAGGAVTYFWQTAQQVLGQALINESFDLSEGSWD